MKKSLVFIWLLLTCFSIAQALIYYGFDGFSKPILGFKAVFNTDLERLRVFATADLDFSFQLGNIRSKLFFNEPVKYIVLDVNKVKLHMGYLRSESEPVIALSPNSWLMQIHSSYMVLSKPLWLYSFTGPIFVGVSSEGDWKCGMNIGDEFKSLYVYRTRRENACFILKFGELSVGVENGIKISMRFEDLEINVITSGSEIQFWGMIVGRNGYAVFNQSYFELMEKVGSGYAIWELSRESKRLSIGYRIEF